jgi:hypothetical protein
MAEGYVPLNPGSGPLQATGCLESASLNNHHQQVALQTRIPT